MAVEEKIDYLLISKILNIMFPTNNITDPNQKLNVLRRRIVFIKDCALTFRLKKESIAKFFEIPEEIVMETFIQMGDSNPTELFFLFENDFTVSTEVSEKRLCGYFIKILSAINNIRNESQKDPEKKSANYKKACKDYIELVKFVGDERFSILFGDRKYGSSKLNAKLIIEYMRKHALSLDVVSRTLRNYKSSISSLVNAFLEENPDHELAHAYDTVNNFNDHRRF